jgi:hypothetical protein
MSIKGLQRVKCVVACRDADGVPAFFPVVVYCDVDQYNDGDHYDAAMNLAEDHSYESINPNTVVFDENDGPEWLFKQFDWEKEVAVIQIDDNWEEYHVVRN